MIHSYEVATINGVGTIYTIVAVTDDAARARRHAGVNDPDAMDTCYTVRVESGPVSDTIADAVGVSWNDAMNAVRDLVAAELVDEVAPSPTVDDDYCAGCGQHHNENLDCVLPPPRITKRK
jgi:hypothetical protein